MGGSHKPQEMFSCRLLCSHLHCFTCISSVLCVYLLLSVCLCSFFATDEFVNGEMKLI
jgi:hypothetical protein